MNGNEFIDAISQLLDEQDLDPQTTHRLLIALTIDTRTEIAACSIANDKHYELLEELITTQRNTTNELRQMIQRHDEYIGTHPSLVYLLRYQTKKTLTLFVFIILILSLWYVSGFRQPILRWLGWPVF